MEERIRMMQTRLELKLEEGRNVNQELSSAREEKLRVEQENTRLRHRSELGFITNCILKFSFLIKFFIKKNENQQSTITHCKIKKTKAFGSSFLETKTFHIFHNLTFSTH